MQNGTLTGVGTLTLVNDDGTTSTQEVNYTTSFAPVIPLPTATLTVDNMSIVLGAAVLLTWSTANADEITLNDQVVVANDSLTIKPMADATYKLVATNSKTGKSASSIVNVAVTQPPPPVAALTLSSHAIQLGDSVTLSWTTANADQVTLNDMSVDANSSQTFTPKIDAVYKLVAKNSLTGISVSSVQNLSVAQPPAPTANLTVTPDSITAGASVSVSWVTANADQVTLNGVAVRPTDNATFSPEATASYNLVATNSLTGLHASASKQVTVTQPAPPTFPTPVFRQGMPPSSLLTKVTIYSVKDGNWSDATVWNTGKIPSDGDFVYIVHNVVYDIQSTAKLGVVEAGPTGSLKWHRTIPTEIWATDIYGPKGTLNLGTDDDPITGFAKLVKRDVPIDTSVDPEQWGGVIGAAFDGKLTICGGEKDSWVWTAKAPLKGDTTVTLAVSPVGWEVGDTLYFSDTREGLRNKVATNTELVVLKSISGTTLTLAAPLQFSHPSAKNVNTGITRYPPVGNLTRKILIISENPQGTRGHFMFSDRADTDGCHYELRDMGRTRYGKRDNTTYDSKGNVTHIGTNQIGRYAWHAHHAVGPENPSKAYQFEHHGVSIWNSVPLADGNYPAWGASIHHSSWGRIAGSIIVFNSEANFVFETGNEWQNVVENNLLGSCWNVANTTAYGYWALTGQNRVRNNCATDIRFGTGSYAYYTFLSKVGTSGGGRPFGNMVVAEHPGDDPMMMGITINVNVLGMLEFANNIAFGCGSGMANYWLGCWAATPCGDGGVISGCKLLNCAYYGNFDYEASHLTIDGLEVVSNDVNENLTTELPWEESDYAHSWCLLQNSSISGHSSGLNLTWCNEGTDGKVVRNCTIMGQPAVNVLMNGARTINPTLKASPRTFVFDNCMFKMITGYNKPWTAINLLYNTSNTDMTSLLRVFVLNYQGTGKNYQVFFTQQAPNFPMPQTNTSNPNSITIGCPVAGLTNADALAQYHVCINGEVIPNGARVTFPEVPNGVFIEIQDLPQDVKDWVAQVGSKKTS